jgi:hypothetical protein
MPLGTRASLRACGAVHHWRSQFLLAGIEVAAARGGASRPPRRPLNIPCSAPKDSLFRQPKSLFRNVQGIASKPFKLRCSFASASVENG